MKKKQFLILIALGIFITSCSKHEGDNTPPPDQNDNYTGISYSKADALSESRMNITAVALGNLAVFAGGDIRHEYKLPNGVPQQEYDPVKSVDIYDAATGTWTTDSLSIARTHMGAIALNGKFYFVGGSTRGNDLNSTASKRIDIYNTVTSDWEIDSLPTARIDVAAVATNNKLLFASGTTVDIYDTQTATWSTVTLSGTVYSNSMASCGDEVFISTYIKDNTTIDIYNTTTNNWRHEHLSFPRRNLTVASSGKFVLFAGGLIVAVGNSDRVDIYNTEADTWEVDTLSTKIWGYSAVTAGNLIFFNGHNFSSRRTFLPIYNTNTGEWSENLFPNNREPQTGVRVGDQILFASAINGPQIAEDDPDHVGGFVYYGSDVVDIFKLIK